MSERWGSQHESYDWLERALLAACILLIALLAAATIGFVGSPKTYSPDEAKATQASICTSYDMSQQFATIEGDFQKANYYLNLKNGAGCP